jgi:pimeloyl-ACP methyl ester carboxylesterase
MSGDPGVRRRTLRGLSGSGFHRLVYWEWGPETAARTVVCLHGLTRNGRDFDDLARALAAAGWRVVCPDVVGRGESDGLSDPAGYGYPQYLNDLTALIARLDVETIDLVGTSMGGLIGMLHAAQPGQMLRRMVINDVGPFVPQAALERIAEYLGKPYRWPDLDAAEAYVREVYAPFGLSEAAQWRRLTEVTVRSLAEGGYALDYDPAIAQPILSEPLADVDLWPVWDAIACPVLALRGVDSDVLLAETAAEMRTRGPKADLVEFSGCGHAPALMDADQIAVVVDWLGRDG